MINAVFGIKVRMSGLCINRCRPIIGHCLIGASLPMTSYNHIGLDLYWTVCDSMELYMYAQDSIILLTTASNPY